MPWKCHKCGSIVSIKPRQPSWYENGNDRFEQYAICLTCGEVDINKLTYIEYRKHIIKNKKKGRERK